MPDCHVLIVEDEPDLRDTLREILTLKGYTCSTAANGREALERLRQVPVPQVVLLDLMMPVMSGWELLQALEREPQSSTQPAIVVTSAVADLSELSNRYSCPILQKPIDLPRLLDLIERACA